MKIDEREMKIEVKTFVILSNTCTFNLYTVENNTSQQHVLQEDTWKFKTIVKLYETDTWRIYKQGQLHLRSLSYFNLFF